MEEIRKMIREVIEQETKEYYDFLKTVSFNELPFTYQKSLILYMLEGDVVDWSIDDPIEIIAKNDDLVKIAINDYVKVGRNKNKSFAYGVVPTEVLTKEIAKRLGYDTFDEYHKRYIDDTDHKDSILPIIIDFENDELIEDGWHRFHSYYKKGIKEIPVVAFM